MKNPFIGNSKFGFSVDCWDGSDGTPVIYHGHTLTSKIRFIDVVKTIKEHAFVKSEYPVILSVENHCSLAQQRYMAMVFKEVFGETLVTQPVEKNGTEMPSPNQLKRRIILKHRKLPDASNANCTDLSLNNNDMIRLMEQAMNNNNLTNNDSDNGLNDLDLINSIKNGILYMENNNFGEIEWQPHFFVLTNNNRLYFLEDTQSMSNTSKFSSLTLASSVSNSSFPDDDDDEQPLLNECKSSGLIVDDTNSTINSVNKIDFLDELHFDEPWFHGCLPGGRTQAEALIRSCANKVDGLFLVRDSSTFVGDYSLSFWKNDKVHHCRIKQKRLPQGKLKYYLIETVMFDTLYYLVTYYQSNALKSQDLTVFLTDPVPQCTTSYDDKEWFNENLSKADSEDLLRRVWIEGAFLVRRSEQGEESYSISFRVESKIKHCRIRREGRLFVVKNQRFENLNDLVCYYQRNPLYK